MDVNQLHSAHLSGRNNGLRPLITILPRDKSYLRPTAFFENRSRLHVETYQSSTENGTEDRGAVDFSFLLPPSTAAAGTNPAFVCTRGLKTGFISYFK